MRSACLKTRRHRRRRDFTRRAAGAADEAGRAVARFRELICVLHGSAPTVNSASVRHAGHLPPLYLENPFEDIAMAKNTGTGSRTGAVTGRTQVDNPKTKDWVKRNEGAGDSRKGEFMDVKEDGKPFKGVAKEPDDRRTKKKS